MKKNEEDSKIIGILKDGQKTNSANAGETVFIITDKTCFYGESGGQIGDTGVMETNNAKIIITDTKKTDAGVFIHIASIKEGTISTDDAISLRIDKARRNKIKANHSATHLLQAALREIAGTDIKQAGSLVEEEKLRFDFQSDEKISTEDLKEIEKTVNAYIFENASLKTEEKSYQDALKEGALAFFENKYSDDVRLVNIKGISKELCGGTHVNNTSEIGLLKITSEGSVGRGLRRITAITGLNAFTDMQKKEDVVSNLCSMLKTKPESLEDSVEKLIKKKQREKTY